MVQNQLFTLLKLLNSFLKDLQLDDSNPKERFIELMSRYTLDYLVISRFSGNFLSIFYRLNDNNVFEIIGHPICDDYDSQTIYINSNTESFTFNAHFW